jgi:tRNA A37 threonylcarbamoyladenosine modification protein TsaB
MNRVVLAIDTATPAVIAAVLRREASGGRCGV